MASEQDDSTQVTHARDIPQSDGVIPWWDAEEAPPDTVLERYSRCPHCDEWMPTINEIYRVWVNRERLAYRRVEHDVDSEMYDAYTEGIHHYRDEYERLTWGLDNAARVWLRELFHEHYHPAEDSNAE